MHDQALVTMIVVLALVWGGFILLLLYALRRERRKINTEQEELNG